MKSKKRLINFDLVLFLFVVSVCCCAGCLAASKVINDGYWHLAMGRYMVKNHTVPSTAVGAWGSNKLSWLPQEWLFEVFSYKLFENNVELFAWFWTAFLIVCIFAIGVGLKLHKNTINKLLPLSVFGALAALLTVSFTHPRPQLVSAILFAIYLFALNNCLKSTKSMKWYTYVYFLVISVLWANFHAGTAILGYMIPLALALILTVTKKLDVLKSYFEIDNSKETIDKLSWIALVMLVGVFITPNGISGFIYPIKSMCDDTMLSVITEWQSPSFGDFTHFVVFYIPFFAFAFYVFFRRKTKCDFVKTLIVCMMVALSFMHIRILIYLYISLMICTVSDLPEIRINVNLKQKGCMSIVMSVSMLIMFGVMFSNVVTTDYEQMEGYSNTEFFDTVKQYAGDRMYNYYDIGSLCQYYDIPVFVDARYDPFSNNRMKEVIKLVYGDSHSDEFIDIMEKYDFTSILDLKDSHTIEWAKVHGYVKMGELSVGSSSDSSSQTVYYFYVKKS